MTEETYDTIIGMPFYRLMPNGEIHNRYGKPIKFDKRGERTMIIGGGGEGKENRYTAMRGRGDRYTNYLPQAKE